VPVSRFSQIGNSGAQTLSYRLLWGTAFATCRRNNAARPAGQLLAFYPASIGSTEKPAPSGHFTVKNISLNPTYRYNPEYAFKGQRTRSPVTVPPGPKNPVGLVWIDLSAKSYGIHGTPTPQNVSKTESHGCIRLTNWDALALAKLVRKGTPVDFID
jgi:lipoprotein-anchoring transpeptidase ErfK/SrfK